MGNSTETKWCKTRGHAIECRINAEDPQEFSTIAWDYRYVYQPSGFRTRVDGAIYQGYKVTPYYDSMVCSSFVMAEIDLRQYKEWIDL